MASAGSEMLDFCEKNQYTDDILKPEVRKYVSIVEKIPESGKLGIDDIVSTDFYRYLTPVPEVYNATTNKANDNIFNIFGKPIGGRKELPSDVRELMVFYACLEKKYFSIKADKFLTKKGLKLENWISYMEKENQRGDELGIFVLSVMRDEQTIIFFKGGLWCSMAGYQKKNTAYLIEKCDRHLAYVGRSFFLELRLRNTILPKTQQCAIRLELVEKTHNITYMKAKYIEQCSVIISSHERDIADQTIKSKVYKIPEEVSVYSDIVIPDVFVVNRINGRIHCPQDKCERSYLHKQDLNRHMLSHNEKNLQCENCTYSTSDPRLLKQHEACHSVDKYDCGICGTTFRHQMQLYRHTKDKRCGSKGK